MKYLLLLFIIYSAQAQETLKILSPHWEGIKYEASQGFESYMKRNFNRTVTLEWLDVGGGTSEMLRFIEGEFKRSPSGIGIDILFGGGTDPFQFLDEKNLLEPITLSDEILQSVPHELNKSPLISEKKTWISPLVGSFGILCNKKVLSFLKIPPPQSWSDLTKSEYKTWIGAADPRKSGSMHAALEVLLQGFGWEEGWKTILKIASNIRSFSSASSTATMQVASGDVACTLAVDSQAWNQIKLDPDDSIFFVIPSEFTLITGDGVSVLKGSNNKSLSEMFITFLLTDEGQKILFLPPDSPGGPKKHFINRLVIKRNLYEEYKEISKNLLNPFEQQLNINYDNKKASLRWGLMNDIFGVFLLEASKASNQSIDRIASMLPNESDLLELSQSPKWKNPIERHKIIEEWKKSLNESH